MQFLQGRVFHTAVVEAAKAVDHVDAWVTYGPESIERLIAERAAAKKAKNYAEADRIRAELLAQGIVLEDGPSGTTWRRQ
jgi:cysteinyl-tRNA synthetase